MGGQEMRVMFKSWPAAKQREWLQVILEEHSYYAAEEGLPPFFDGDDLRRENEDLRRQIDQLRRGKSRTPGDAIMLTPLQIRAEMSAMAARAGLTLDEALRMLDAGELDGTPLEVELEARRLLLGEPARQKSDVTS